MYVPTSPTMIRLTLKTKNHEANTNSKSFGNRPTHSELSQRKRCRPVSSSRNPPKRVKSERTKFNNYFEEVNDKGLIRLVEIQDLTDEMVRVISVDLYNINFCECSKAEPNSPKLHEVHGAVSPSFYHACVTFLS